MISTLLSNDDVITFVNRNLEPYRGYHTFMRSLPYLLKNRPNLHVLIIGGNGVSYGNPPPNGGSWSEIFAAEVRPHLTDQQWRQIHFLGKVPYEDYVSILKLSTVHVYLTYPFVLSWSLLEAMSIGCAIVASDTPPLYECIIQKDTGVLTSFFDPKKLSDEIVNLLENPELRKKLGANARQFACDHYDLSSVILPRQIKWVNSLLDD